MPDRIEQLLREADDEQPHHLMCALVAGDPHADRTIDYLETIAQAGADVLELIVPFSDPAYHGPVIQRACERSLSEDLTWDDIRYVVEGFRDRETETALVISSYYNRILAYGLEPFSELLDSIDVDGVMVADLPWDESGRLREALDGAGVPLVPTVAPTTSRERIAMMVRESESFFLWTGHSGGEVTLSREEFAASMSSFREVTERPILASMKISTGEEAAAVVEYADGVLVGSAIVWLIEGRDANLGDRLSSLVRELREGLARESV